MARQRSSRRLPINGWPRTKRSSTAGLIRLVTRINAVVCEGARQWPSDCTFAIWPSCSITLQKHWLGVSRRYALAPTNSRLLDRNRLFPTRGTIMRKRVLPRFAKGACVKQADAAVHAEVEFRIAQVGLALASRANALRKAALSDVIT